MNVKLLLCAAALAAGGALLWIWAQARTSPARPSAATGSAAESGVRAETPQSEALAPARRGEVSERTVPGESVHETSAAVAELRTVRGRVLDPEAAPLPGIEVEFDGPPVAGARARAVSGPGGYFELVAPALAEGSIVAADPRLVTVLFGRLRAGMQVEPLLVVAPARDLAGHVVDEFGSPLAGARVALEPPEGFLRRFDVVLDANHLRETSVTSNADGRFELLGAAEILGATVVASLSGFAPARVPAPAGNDLGLSIVLERASAEGEVLIGSVVDPDGQPVAGARVSLGADTVVTDIAGEFRLPTAGSEDAYELLAVHPGHLPGRLQAGRDPTSGAPMWPSVIVLRLGSAPLAISGVVVDSEGRPRPDLHVWLAEPTHFGAVGDMDGSVEFLIAPEEGSGDEYWRWSSTDAEGRFRVGGLMPRAYELRFMDLLTLEQKSAGPFDAGSSGVRVVFDHGPLVRVAGRVVSKSGAPIAGVTLMLMRPTWGGVSTDLAAGSAVSDAAGRFAFDGVAGEDLSLWARGDDVVPQMIAVPLPTDGFEIVLAVRCHLKVDLGARPERADAVEVLDDQGALLELMEIDASGVTTMPRAPLVEGRSATLGVDETARTLVLLKGGVEVQRLVLELRPRVVNRIEP